ncbi:MAG TPA: enoyl-CoA hydratase-related protein, partial [Trebonia sp.]|jgi:enoyl-CoA hydratase/carnithine racemase
MVEDESRSVLLDVAGDGVATLTLNRPDRHNAWNPVLERRFYQLLDEAGRDDRVRAVVLTGAGRSFCPGVDSQRLDGIAGRAMDLTGRTSPAVTYTFRKPLIAAVNGACAGLGLVQALMCDVRFAARGAKFATSFSRRGLAGEYGMTWLLPRLIGTERALDLLISGRTVDADEARDLGLVSRVTEPGELLPAAAAYARDLAANCSPASMAVIKHQVLTDLDATCEQAMRGAYRAMAVLAEGPDFREGIDSFLQKRPPNFPPLPADLKPADITGTALTAPAIDPMDP